MPTHYDQLVAPDSFVGRYLAYMRSQETAHNFDFWCALWCLSAACGRRVWVARPRAPVYLNMYCVLISESGVARKSSSIAMASGLVGQLLQRGDVGFMNSKVTAEALDDYLHQRTMEFDTAQLCITVSELAVFMGTESYVANMPTLLTDLYDCPDRRHGGGTISRGSCIQRNVWLSFLSASTPVWLLKTVNPNVVEGGFTSRCYFIVSNKPKRRIAWLDEAPREEDYHQLQDMLFRISTQADTHHDILLTDAALSHFREWYNQRDHELDPFKQSFQAREDAHVLRIAAFLCINDDTWVIDTPHVKAAIKLIAEIKAESSRIFENTEARTSFAYALEAIRSMLISTGMDPIPRHKLYYKCRHHVTNPEFMALLEALHDIGAIQRFTLQNDDGRGRPSDFIRGTDMLVSQGLGEKVLDRFT